jgi:hypothetical protein
MSEIHPFIFVVIAEFALFVALLLGASLWSGAANAPADARAHAVTKARSPSGLRAIVRN